MSTERILIPLILALGGCAHLASVSVTPVPAAAGEEIRAVAESPLIVLGIRTDHAYVDHVVRDLRRQCEGGQVQGILTKHEVIAWPFVNKHRITATGRCVR